MATLIANFSVQYRSLMASEFREPAEESAVETLTPTLMEDGAMSIGQAEKFTSFKRTFLYQLMERGDLKYAKVGKRRVIPKSELVRLLESAVVGGVPEGAALKKIGA